MRRAVAIILVILVVGAGIAGFLYANRMFGGAPSGQGDGQLHISRPRFKGNEVVLEKESIPPAASGDPVKNALDRLFGTAEDGKGASAFPKGTRLLSLKIQDKLAVLDLSEDFKAVNNMGDTGESLAQNALRDTLAQFPQIEKMRVLVAGRAFEGEHSGPWDDIPVRDSNAHAGGSQ
jgi:hypothetical protein